jgi:ABC-type Na+ efflux pump permease subunit
MALMPVVHREMTALARRQSTYWIRSIAAVVAVLTMIWLMLISASRVSVSDLGSSIFMILSGFCFAFALLVGMQATSDCVSEEKREGTLGLLFLTDLRALHIIFGKMTASSFGSLFAILGVVPMLSLALLLGGVTLTQVALVALVLANTLFLSLSLGLFVSVLSQNERKAMFACFIGLFLITIMPFIISIALNDFGRIEEKFVWISPLYSYVCTQVIPAGGFNTRYLPHALLAQHALAWIFLILGGRILPRCVHEVPSVRFARIKTMIDNYVFGRIEVRKRYRAALLDRNAFLWLASRERVKPKYAWLVVGFFGLLFLWVAIQFNDMFYDPPVALTIVFLVHIIFKLWSASEVCSRLLTDRRSGALELLLSTPLSERDIARGQSLALARIFGGPIRLLVVAEIVLMFATVFSSRRTPEHHVYLLYGTAVTTFLLDLWALKWVGLWLSLFGKSIERVLIATLGRVLGVPAILFTVIAGSLNAIVSLQAENIPAAVNYAIFWGISVSTSIAFGVFAKRNFLLRFREAAVQRFDSQARPEKIKRSKQRPLNQPNQLPPWRVATAAMRSHWVLTGSAIVLALAILGPFCRKFYWKRQVAAQLRLVRSQNQPTRAEEIGKIYAPLPANEDAFASLRQVGAINRNRWLSSSYSSAWFAKNRSNWADSFKQCQQLVTNNQPQLDALRDLHRYQKAYMAPHDTYNWMLPIDIPGYWLLAAADVAVALEEKDRARVLTDIKALLHFFKLVRAQPVPVLLGHTAMGLVALGNVLQASFTELTLTSEELLDLQTLLEKIDPVPHAEALTRGLSVHRAALLESWGQLDPRYGTPPPMMAAGHGLLAAVGTYDRVLTETLAAYDSAIRFIASGSPAELLRQPFLCVSAPRFVPMFNIWANPAQVDLPSIIFHDVMVSARLELLRTAIAAERYQVTQHCFPPKLLDLVPRFLEARPTDLFSGEALESAKSGRNLLIQSPVRKKEIGVRMLPERLTFELPRLPSQSDDPSTE